MSLMKMAANFEGKSDVVFSQPLAAAVTVDADEIALWIGVLPSVTRLVEIDTQVRQMLQRLREIGTTTSGVGLYTTAVAVWATNPVAKKDIVITVDQIFAIPTAASAHIWVGELFQPLPGTSISTAIKRLFETWSEQVGKSQ